MVNRSLKYKMLLSAFRVLPVKKLMAASPEKTQKLFREFGKIFEDMGHSGLVGENTDRFSEEVKAAHEHAIAKCMEEA